MKKICEYLIIVNLISFFTYWLDKKLAIKHKERIPEIVLILLSIIGGALGSLLSMYINHHKTKKWYFVVINLGLTILYIYLIIKEKIWI